MTMGEANGFLLLGALVLFPVYVWLQHRDYERASKAIDDYYERERKRMTKPAPPSEGE